MVNAEFIEGLFEHFLPELKKKFTIRKLSLLSKLSYDAAYRHVHYLVEEKAFKEEKVGAYSYIGINFESSLARKNIEKISLKKTSEFLKKNAVMRKLLEELSGELEKSLPNELLSVVLYGSYAKGTETKNSDVDVFIVVSSFEVREKVERVCDSVEMKYGKAVAPLITTASELKIMLNSEKLTVAQEILSSGVVLSGYEKYYLTVFDAVRASAH
ncbi:MAG: nucleotidyltransferase domain-containing protein [Candidatus Micrarchaeota archaeon]